MYLGLRALGREEREAVPARSDSPASRTDASPRTGDPFLTTRQRHGPHINPLRRAACRGGRHHGGSMRPAPRRPARGPIAFQSTPVPKRGGVAAPGRAAFAGAAGAPPRGSPAHDLVGQQHAAHLRVLVLALVDDGLRGRQAEAGLRGARGGGAPSPPGLCGPRGRQVHGGRGEAASGEFRPPGGVTRAWLGRGGLLSWAPAGPARGLLLGRTQTAFGPGDGGRGPGAGS